jgi:hypothetical protein
MGFHLHFTPSCILNHNRHRPIICRDTCVPLVMRQSNLIIIMMFDPISRQFLFAPNFYSRRIFIRANFYSRQFFIPNLMNSHLTKVKESRTPIYGYLYSLGAKTKNVSIIIIRLFRPILFMPIFIPDLLDSHSTKFK